MEQSLCWPSHAPAIPPSNILSQAIEMETRNDNEKWKEYRKGRITSTMVKTICTSSDHRRTAFEFNSRKDISHLPFVKRGIADEELGVNYLTRFLHQEGRCSVAYRIGFVIHPNYPWLGASPDRLINVDHIEWSLVEIKNWYVTERQKSINNRPYLDEKLKLKHNHSYFYQIQTALLVTGLDKCYFVVHGANSAVEAIFRDEKTISEILEKCELFSKDWLSAVGR